MKDFTFIFMVYNLDPLNAYNRTDSDVVYGEIIDQLKQMPISSKSNYVLIDHKTEYTADLNIPYRNTKIRPIEKGSDKENLINDPVFNFGARNIGDGDSLAGIFLLVKEKFPADKFILFTYDHSNFTGHLTSRIRLEDFIRKLQEKVESDQDFDHKFNELFDTDKRFDIIELLPSNKELKAWIPDFRNPENYDMLTNAELANALNLAFVINGPIPGKAGNRLEAVFFDSCYIAAIDNLYLYADSCKYIVASQGAINYNSFNVSNILERFYSGLTTEDVLKHTMEKFEEEYKQLVHHAGSSDYKKTVVNAFRLSETYRKDFREIFNSLTLDLIADIESIANYIKKRLAEPDFWEDCYYIFYENKPDPKKQEFDTQCIDFFSFFEDLKNDNPGKTYNKKILELLNFASNTRVAGFSGLEGRQKELFNGLSIWFNRNILTLHEKLKKQIEYSYSFYSVFQNDFAKNTYWAEFIQVYQKKIIKYR